MKNDLFQKENEKNKLNIKDIQNNNSLIYNFILKTFNCFVNRYYFQTLHPYDFIPLQVTINNLKLFQEDKLICISYQRIFIYRIIDKLLLFSGNITNDNHLSPKRNIELYENDKFFLFDSEGHYDLLRLFHFTKNLENNSFLCQNILNINEKPFSVLFKKNKMFCICRHYLCGFRGLCNWTACLFPLGII